MKNNAHSDHAPAHTAGEKPAKSPSTGHVKKPRKTDKSEAKKSGKELLANLRDAILKETEAVMDNLTIIAIVTIRARTCRERCAECLTTRARSTRASLAA